jgi:hypothetical protein
MFQWLSDSDIILASFLLASVVMGLFRCNAN